MRFVICALALFAVAPALSTSAQADPYRWCAQYGRGNQGTNCYFKTLQQCQEAISGNGGVCRPNLNYDGDAPNRGFRWQ